MTRMTLLLMNLLLALIWVLLWGDITIYTVTTGLIGGYFVLWVFTRATARDAMREAYGAQIFGMIRFTLYFLLLLIRSNIVLAWEILTPGWGMSPRILRYDVSHMSDAQIVTFSNALTLTPGTLTVDISDDKRHLYIHFMYAADPRQALRELDGLRRRMEREVFRVSSTAAGPKPPPDTPAFHQ